MENRSFKDCKAFAGSLICSIARVLELVYRHASEACGRKAVEVRVLSRAPKFGIIPAYGNTLLFTCHRPIIYGR